MDLGRSSRFVPFLSCGNKLSARLEHLAGIFQAVILARPGFKNVCRLRDLKEFKILILRSTLPIASENILEELNSSTFPASGDAHRLNDKCRSLS